MSITSLPQYYPPSQQSMPPACPDAQTPDPCSGSGSSPGHASNGSLIDIDVGTGVGGGSGSGGAHAGGSLVDLDVGSGGSGSLIDAQIGGGSVLDASVGSSDDYSGINLQAAVLADQGLLGDFATDGLLSVDVDGGLPIDLGHLALPDLPDIGGLLDTCSA